MFDKITTFVVSKNSPTKGHQFTINLNWQQNEFLTTKISILSNHVANGTASLFATKLNTHARTQQLKHHSIKNLSIRKCIKQWQSCNQLDVNEATLSKRRRSLKELTVRTHSRTLLCTSLDLVFELIYIPREMPYLGSLNAAVELQKVEQKRLNVLCNKRSMGILLSISSWRDAVASGTGSAILR